MTGKYEATVTAGGAGADAVLLNKADTFACFRQIVGDGQSDNSTADYENIAVCVHLIAYIFPICLSNHMKMERACQLRPSGLMPDNSI